MYVAITRARKELYLTLAEERMLQGRTFSSYPSSFLTEIPGETLKWLSRNPFESRYEAEDEDSWEADPARIKIIQVLIAILLMVDLQNRPAIDSLQMFLNGRRELLKRRKKNSKLRKYVLNRILIHPIKQVLILIMKNLVPVSSLILREQGTTWS